MTSSALRLCLRIPIVGYADPRLVDLIRMKTDRYRKHVTLDDAHPVLRQIVQDSPNPLSVLDFGGAFATAYWPLQALVRHWTVVEQLAIVSQAGDLISPHLDFVTRIEQSEPVDLIWASGSIPYALDAWPALLAHRAPLLAVTRMTPWLADGATPTRRWQRSRLSGHEPGPDDHTVRDRWVFFPRHDVSQSWLCRTALDAGYVVASTLDDGYVFRRQD